MKYYNNLDHDYPAATVVRYIEGEETDVVYFDDRFAIQDLTTGHNVVTFNDEDETDERLREAQELTDQDNTERFDIIDAADMFEWPQWFTDRDFGQKWVSTDAWRGYVDVTHGDSLVPLASGWVTGYPDQSVAHKMTAAELNQALADQIIPKPPVEMFWTFAPTSNVFSMSSEILIPNTDEAREAISEWFKQIGFEQSAVERAFS